MKLFSYPLWIFLYLLFFGIGVYLYIVSIQSWRHSRMYHLLPLSSRQWRGQKSNQPAKGRLHFSGPHNSWDLENLNLGNFSADVPLDVARKILRHKMQVITEFRRAVLEWKTFQTNYNVPYRPLLRPRKLSAEDILCAMKAEVKLHTLGSKDCPFLEKHKQKLFPTTDLFQGERFHSCAVVSSSGSLYKSGLGKEIDSHDVVVRFNDAPTEGYVEDVGNKTTLRIVNSQVVSLPEFNFLESALWQNVILLAWDPNMYDGTMQEWFRRPDFDLFTPYFERRLKQSEQPFYILHPGSLWLLWDFLQAHTPARILGNPPSSGFLGMVLMLQHCKKVDMYEFIPSLRLSPVCHYYSEQEDSGCTFGHWHPLAAEKLLALSLNAASDHELTKAFPED